MTAGEDRATGPMDSVYLGPMASAAPARVADSAPVLETGQVSADSVSRWMVNSAHLVVRDPVTSVSRGHLIKSPGKECNHLRASRSNGRVSVAVSNHHNNNLKADLVMG